MYLPHQLRARQILLIGVVSKQATTVLQGAYYFLVFLVRNCRATSATAQAAILLAKLVANIIGTVHYCWCLVNPFITNSITRTL